MLPNLVNTPMSIRMLDSTTPTSTDLLESVVDDVVRTMGYELVLLEWLEGRHSRRLRVFLDHPNGISLDDTTKMSRVISNALDAAEAAEPEGLLGELLRAPYTLEVSSPGIERPLVKLGHFTRFVGHRVTIRTRQPLSPDSLQKTFHGHIAATEPDALRPEDERSGIVVLHALDGGTPVRISIAQIRRANLVYEG